MRIDPPQCVPLLCRGKNPTDVSVLSTLTFYLRVAFHHKSLEALVLLLTIACPSPTEKTFTSLITAKKLKQII